ncbi:hypothetical protein PLESTB_001480600 [Pleodorina starrii]|uniref:Translin family protein n=1 Tax=Pleodorina starrii TaxID=330485 RepID=A0A9W6F871_9CHLO|nr:hypothetical protein PLESTM_000652100 [Pleodorina starrii]GLC59385.1 hypothetical protein PLESTB_001480600 [Pleodorina starrii]GLC74416.1 hypothetical protein PLESTF_001510700 [Pleodorina starrii]
MLLAGSVIRSTFAVWCRHGTFTCRTKVRALGGGWLVLTSPKRPQLTAHHIVRCTASSSPSPASPLDANISSSGGSSSSSSSSSGGSSSSSSSSGGSSSSSGGATAASVGPTIAAFTAIADMAMSEAAMLTVSDWDKLGQHLASYDEMREGVIKKCRDVQKLAKQAVYSLHRGDVEGAAKQLTKAESLAGEMLPTISRHPALRAGSYSAAIEEYVEARAFGCFLSEGRLIRSDELPLAEPEEFLGGVLDFTGELNRYAIARATVRDKAAVQRCRDLVDALMGRFLQFDLRNGSLRKKYDSLKYTLKKMESTLYELALTEAMGLKVHSEAAAMDPEVAAAGDVGEGEA